MNSIQLNHILSNDPFVKKSFAGVYAVDQLPSVTVRNYPKSFVINTDPKTLPGTHWIAVYFTDKMNGEFFDSYGQHPNDYDRNFIDFIERNALEWTYNEKRLQSPFSTVCGQYCIYYLVNRCRLIPLNTIVNRFSIDTFRNDQIVDDFVKKHYKKAYPSVKQQTDFVLSQISRRQMYNK